MTGPLADVVIADFTQLMQGAWAAQKLGDMGADVIKIEPPGGELERDIPVAGEMYGEESILYLAMNRNKRSVVVDLKSDEGKRVARDIVE
jgi:crotonobetainyl-CoA:carnitine CoA-transferase CaiB-like acyl-CoA transferase